MANLIPMEMRRRTALVKVALTWGAAAVLVAVGLTVLAADAGARVARADRMLASAKGQYDGLEALVQATRRLGNQRDQLFRKQRTIETLRRDQRAIQALRDLSDLGDDAIWLEQVSFSEAAPKEANSSANPKPQRAAAAGSRFRVPEGGADADSESHRALPVTVTVSGFALSQQELADFYGRMAAHDRFAGVDLRWSSRTSFLDGQAIKFVISGAYQEPPERRSVNR